MISLSLNNTPLFPCLPYTSLPHPPQLLHPVLLTFIIAPRFFISNIFPEPPLEAGAGAGAGFGAACCCCCMKPNILILTMTNYK